MEPSDTTLFRSLLKATAQLTAPDQDHLRRSFIHYLNLHVHLTDFTLAMKFKRRDGEKDIFGIDTGPDLALAAICRNRHHDNNCEISVPHWNYKYLTVCRYPPPRPPRRPRATELIPLMSYA